MTGRAGLLVLSRSNVARLMDYADYVGEILSGRRPGRTNAETITLFDSTGMGLQDVAAAAAIYRRAQQAGAGTRLSLD
jgi:ornithine cyclodeaminase/alanine dehydrogenase-like protein (mu-crystallin family)